MTAELAAELGNLPAEPNNFIGRERDLAELAAILGRVRALTLCGPGGIGKTRLALRLGAVLGAQYPAGVWIADLADVDPDEARAAAGTGQPVTGTAGEAAAGGVGRVVALVAAALGIRQEADRLLADTLAEALRPRTMLLILDTCEHLVEACAELVQRLLARCPGLRVIATSREPLGVRGEIIWRVPPLGLPQAVAGEVADAAELARCEAVQLFLERAAAVRPDFSQNEGNL